MHKTTGTPAKASVRPWRIALALAVLAGGLSCAWTVAQNAPAETAAAPAAPVTTPAPTPAASAATPAAPVAGTGTAPVGTHANKSAGKSPARKPENKLAWANLTPAQREALEPLAGEWPRMREQQKEKWLEIGKRYTRMKPEAQQRLHERMRDWVKLTPAERSAARTNYARAKKLDAEEKHEQWAKYQQLSEEQKKKLAESRLPRRVAKLPTSPSAAAPVIQLPAEALDRPLPVVPAPTPASAPAPALVPGSQATPVPAMAPTASAPAAVAVSAAVAPAATVSGDSQ